MQADFPVALQTVLRPLNACGHNPPPLSVNCSFLIAPDEIGALWVAGVGVRNERNPGEGSFASLVQPWPSATKLHSHFELEFFSRVETERAGERLRTFREVVAC